MKLFTKKSNLQKNTWQDLTDEEIKQIKIKVNYNQFMTAGEYATEVGKEIQKKLKDKNNLF